MWAAATLVLLAPLSAVALVLKWPVTHLAGTVGTGVIVGWLGDRIRRRGVESLLREREERFRAIADVAPVMIWICDTNKRCTYFNRPWLTFTGRRLEQEYGDGWMQGIHPDDVEGCFDGYVAAFDRRQPFHPEYRLRRHNGDYRWLLDEGIPRFRSDGVFAGYIGSAIDVTELKRAGDVLTELNRRLIEAQERERAWIARELHDDVSQRIAILTMMIHRIQQRLPNNAGVARGELLRIYDSLADLSAKAQGLAHTLHPPDLDLIGLASAAAGFCQEFSRRHDIEVRFSQTHVPRTAPADVALALFRVLQEALANAAKHSGARAIDVILSARREGEIHLTVTDTGIGFDPPRVGSGLGLVSMSERMGYVGGDIRIRVAAWCRNDAPCMGAICGDRELSH
jgi:PAS domain S-box-containing protein